jgi:DNA-binding NarL/FixJ family response regulator
VTRVVIADDHPLFLDGLQALLAGAFDIDVVARAETSPQAVDVVTATRPDVVVLDLNMPGPGGIATIREIGDRVPSARVLVLTMYDDDGLVFDAVRAGALGYVLKGAAPDEVIQAVVLELLARGLRNAAIAQRLGISLKTVRNVVSSVLTKLQVPDREAATRRAREAGLGRRPGSLPDRDETPGG